MALFGSIALALRARTEGFAADLRTSTDAIKQWAVEARKAGMPAQEVSQRMAEMQRNARAVAEQGAAAEKGLKNLKTVASSTAGAVSALSSEMGGAVGSVTRLGGSLIQSFLAGGPIAAGITGITALVSGLVSGLGAGSEEIEKTRAASNRMAAEMQTAFTETLSATERLWVIIKSMREGRPEDVATYDRQAELNKKITDSEERRAHLVERIRNWQKEIVEEEESFFRLKSEIAKREAWIAADQRENVKLLKQEEADRERFRVDQIRIAEELGQESRKETSEITRQRKEREQQVKKERELLQIRRELNNVLNSYDPLPTATGGVPTGGGDGLSSDAREAQGAFERFKERVGSKEWMDPEDFKDVGKASKQVSDDWEKTKKESEQAALNLGKHLTAFEKAHAEHQRFIESMRYETELQRAGNEFARERLRIQHELTENLIRAGADEAARAAAKELSAAKLTSLAKEEAEAAKAKADAEKKAAIEKQKAAEHARTELDITQKFANFNGAAGGAFGFGKGMVGGTWSAEGGDFAKRKNGPKKGAGSAGGAGGDGSVPQPPADATPKIDFLIKTIGRWAESNEKHVAGWDKFGQAVESAADRAAKATERGFARMDERMRRMEQKQRSLEQRIDRLSAGVG